MLQKIIHQLNEDDYSRFHSEIEKTKASKMVLLLKSYRNLEIENKDIPTILNVTKESFYCIKSRLFDHLQLFLVKRNCESNSNPSDNEQQINELIYNTPREIAIPILNYLEKEFIKNDRTSELLVVYKAFKKIYLCTEKYHYYSQQYNKYTSYLLAQDKAEDLVGDFCISLGSYYLNRDDSDFNRLNLLRKEMNQLLHLNNFPRIKIYNNILMLQYALFLSDIENDYDNIPVELLLQESDNIIQNHYQEIKYKHLSMVMNCLYFEYFNQLKIQTKATEYFNKINKMDFKLKCYGHLFFTALFFISKREYYHEKDIRKTINLYTLNASLIPPKENILCYVFYIYNTAIELYFKNKLNDSILIINKLFSEISFKNYSFIEIELRLFISFLHIFLKERKLSKISTDNTLRKIKDEINSAKYANVILCIELLRAINKQDNKISNVNKEQKIVVCYQRFKMNNQGMFKILEFLTEKDELLNKLKTI